MLCELLIFSTANMGRNCGELSRPARSRPLRASGTCQNISPALSHCRQFAEAMQPNRAYWTLHAIYDNQPTVGFRIGFIFFFFLLMTLACLGIVYLKCVLLLQGLESADERCRPERCWPEGMMGRRNKARAVQCSHLFRSQHKGSMVIHVDMCFVFDSLGSSFHTHTMENDVFMYFLHSVCLASVDFCAVHLSYSTMSLSAFSLLLF